MLGRAGSERWTRSRRSSRNSRMRRLPSLLSTSLPLLILYCTYLPISPFSFGISVRGRALEGLSLCSYKRCLCQINRISGQSSVPLDVPLLHGHALALPYPHFPALCFLAYLSPRAYLSIQRSAPVNAAQQLPSIDIPSITVSTRILHPEVSLVQPSLSYHLNRPIPPADRLLASRPSFPLAPTAPGFTHNFPLPTTGTEAGKNCWVLSFGKGIIMGQSRILEIARVVQPHVLWHRTDPYHS